MEIARPRYMEELVAKKGNGLVKVVTGVRRCGKSYLLLNMFKGHLAESGVAPGNIVELAFDRFSSAPLRDPREFYSWVTARLGEAGPGERYVLLDEVQLLGRFEEVLVDLMAIPGVDVYVTGSNARLLSHDIATEFRGRGDEVALRPLGFSEYAAARGGDLTKADLFVLKLTGAPDSAQRRENLLKKLDLPQHLTTNALLTVLNALYSREELELFLQSTSV